MKEFKRFNDYELLYLISWNSNEALEILLDKYNVLIKIKLVKFNISRREFTDFEQELKMEVYKATKTYDDSYGKSFCRFVELVIDRKILRLIHNNQRSVYPSLGLDDSVDNKSKLTVLETMIYEEKIKQILEANLDSKKKSILNEVILDGMTIKEYSNKHNMTVKEVYNHIYSLRLKIKRED